MHPDTEHLRELPIAEKLRVVEELWDDIAASGEPLPLPRWHREEALRRDEELKADPSLAIDREELWRRVDESRG
jgi:putative addiction module component (TIGR02574 family)